MNEQDITLNVNTEPDIDVTVTQEPDVQVTVTGSGGPQGDKGETGEKGEKGDPGTGVNIVGSLNSPSELPASANEGDCYMIAGDLWLWDGMSWNNVGQIKGDPGTPVEIQKGATHIQWRYVGDTSWTDIVSMAELKGATGEKGEKGEIGATGASNTLTIGNVAQGSANATITGTSPNQVLNLTLPKGDKGDKGDTGSTGATGEGATVTIGNVTTVTPATPASVTNVGTTTHAIFDIEIPKGDTGASGAGSGDMLKANNLSDVANADTSRNNLDAVKAAVSSTDNAIARFDGATGKVIQNSTVKIDDIGNLQSDGLIESTTIAGAPMVVADEIVEYYENTGVLVDGLWIKDGMADGVDISDLYTTVSTKANAVHTHTLADITDSGALAAKSTVAMTDIAATGGTAASFLKKDGTWATPTNTTYSEITDADINTGTASTARAISGRRAQTIVNKSVAESYPVGSIYMSAVANLPASINAVGTWTQIYANSGTVAVGGLSGFSEPATVTVTPRYEWRRTA